MSSRAYEKLLHKLDKPNTGPIDPKIALLQQRFSSILESSKKDVLGRESEEDNQDEDMEDEDMEDVESEIGEIDEDFDVAEGEDLYEGFDFDGDGFDTESLQINGRKATLNAKGANLNDIDEEAQDEEDDELNIFEYDWDIERDESDSELDGNDEASENEDNTSQNEDVIGPKQKKSKTTISSAPIAPIAKPTVKEPKTKQQFTQTLYDQYFKTSLSPVQIERLEAQSAFIQPQSDQIGLKLRKDMKASDLAKILHKNSQKMNKTKKASNLKLFGHQVHIDDNNDNQNDDDDENYPERSFHRVENAVLRTGTIIDQYNLPSAQHQYSKYSEDDYDELIDYDINKLSANQIGAQQVQIHSDRLALNLPILPDLPPSDSKYPVDQYGDGLIVTAGKDRARIQKMEDNGTWKRSGYKKSQLSKLKAASDKISKMVYTRRIPSWRALGLKQRFAQHLTEKGFFTPTAYNIIRQAYIGYNSDITQYEFVQHIQTTMKDDKVNLLSQDHGLALPSYQNEAQALFASFLATYNDVFITPSIPPPNQQIDWYQYRDVYLVHIINHLLIHRDRIVAHNEALYRRDARNMEQDFISQLSRMTDLGQRHKALENHLDELYKVMDDDKKTAAEQQEAQARLAVLTHSSKTRLQIKQLQDLHQIQQDKQKSTTNVSKQNNIPIEMNDVAGNKKKGHIKKQEKEQHQKRHLLDLEFQKQIADLSVSNAKNQLSSMRSLNDQTNNKYRDQGYTRPTVLLLAPSKLHAYIIITRLLELLPTSQTKRVHNLERFHQDFGDSEGSYSQASSKPLDYHLNFNGNNDDCFRFGIQLNAHGVKLYSPLYSSDIIIASPLGLKLIVGNEGTQPHERKADFLSSIEICVVDQLQLIMNQNIDHFTDVLQCLNGYPTKTQNIDFSRIKEQFLNGHGRFHRQNIWCSGVITPSLQHLYQTFCENKNGRLRLRPLEYDNISPYFKLQGILKQSFYKLELALLSTTTNLMKKKIEETIFDKKLHIWFNEVWPRVKDWYQHEGNTVIFVPSSYDFVRVRNIMEEKFVDYCICSEYTDQRLIDSYRTRIHKGTAKFILVSERFWVFNRSTFNGIKHIVWYGVPTMPQAYIDFVNYIKPSSSTALHSTLTSSSSTGQLSSSNVNNLTSGYRNTAAKQPTSFLLYSIHDAMALERIVGTDFARELLTSTENMHTIQ